MGAHAEIVAYPQFYSAVVKLQRDNANTLSREKRKAVAMILLHEENDTTSTDEELSFMQRALKRQKIFREYNASRYLDSRFFW